MCVPARHQRAVALVFLPERPNDAPRLYSLATYLEWRRLIVAHTISGVAVHDARIIASMKVYNVRQLVTFNVDDFRRYRDISVITPQALSSLAP